MSLDKKYRHLRQAVRDDPMHFTDINFTLEPLSGEIWPGSECEIVCTFKPEMASTYDCVAFLDVVGRDVRLPLRLEAEGVGPKAAFTYDVLDIGDVFISATHKYKLVLENHGDIDANFSLLPNDSRFGPQFKFEPSEGKLGVAESIQINVTFCSSILGECECFGFFSSDVLFNHCHSISPIPPTNAVSEHFRFGLKGSQETLGVHFKGHVVGPTFHFDVDDIDFGTISYDFAVDRKCRC